MKSSFQKWAPLVAAVAVGAFASTATAQDIPPEKVKNPKSLIQYYLWQEFEVTLKQANADQFLAASELAIANSQQYNGGKIKPSAVVKEALKYNPQYAPLFTSQSLTKWVDAGSAGDKKAIKEWSNTVKNAFSAGLKNYKKQPSPGNNFTGAANKADAAAAITAQAILAVKDVPPTTGSSKATPVSPLQYIVANTVKLAGKAKVAKGDENTGTAAFAAGLMTTLAQDQQNEFGNPNDENNVLAAVIVTSVQVAGAKKALDVAYGAAYGFALKYVTTTPEGDRISLEDFLAENFDNIVDAILLGFKKPPKESVVNDIKARVDVGINVAYLEPENGPGYVALIQGTPGNPAPVTDIQGL